MAKPERDWIVQNALREADEKEKREAVRLAMTARRDFGVYRGGKPSNPKNGGQGSHGWNIGDIDFDSDGSIFIRNPYLANAIEEQLKANHKNWQVYMERKEMGTLGPNDTEPVLFRLTRDEGWSGEKQNVVC